MQWDIFCRVIDNFGDIGVCWRLCVNLAQRGQHVRLWADDVSALAWMAPDGAPGVQVLPWRTPFDAHDSAPCDVLVEAFGCEIDPEFITSYASKIRARGQPCLWINLEYLSAEPYARGCHGLPSPVMSGPGRGLTKHFFYPGFTAGTGGLLRESDLLARQAGFDRAAWLAQHRIAWLGERLVSLFCYESAGLPALLEQLSRGPLRTRLLVTPGCASAAIRQCIHDKNRLKPLWNKREKLLISYLPALSQTDYDHLLWACDLNFVRGEDSLVRALWAGKPLIWQIYPQQDQAHHVKLDAWHDWLEAPASLRLAHARWNDNAASKCKEGVGLFDEVAIAHWQVTFCHARDRLLGQDDLGTQLINFVTRLVHSTSPHTLPPTR